MTVDDAKDAIEEIRGLIDDDERAHAAEDDLRERVLKHIARGGADAQRLAQIALSTSKMDFARWCA
jgi:hypothetical protein